MPFMTVCYNRHDYSFCLPVVFFLQNDALQTALDTCFHMRCLMTISVSTPYCS